MKRNDLSWERRFAVLGLAAATTLCIGGFAKLVPLITVVPQAQATPVSAEWVQAGKAVYDEQGCGGCHRPKSPLPDLSTIGGRYSDERLRQQITAPQTLSPSSAMPAYADLAQEKLPGGASRLDALVAYLQSLKGGKP